MPIGRTGTTYSRAGIPANAEQDRRSLEIAVYDVSPHHREVTAKIPQVFRIHGRRIVRQHGDIGISPRRQRALFLLFES